MTRQSAKHNASAYTPLMRARYVFKFFRAMAALGPGEFEATKSAHVGKTYGLDTNTVKRIKARFRCELSFGEGK